MNNLKYSVVVPSWSVVVVANLLISLESWFESWLPVVVRRGSCKCLISLESRFRRGSSWFTVTPLRGVSIYARARDPA